MNENSERRAFQAGLIVYDGSCGACSAFIGENSNFFEKHGFEVKALQEAGVTETVKVDRKILMQEIHLLTAHGKVFRGIDAFEYFCGKVWWLRPVSWLMKVPALKWIGAKIYRLVAANRQRFSKILCLENRTKFGS